MRTDLIGLSGTVLARANLRGSDLTSLVHVGRTDFTGAELVAARFGDTMVSGVTLVDADLTGSDLDLTGAVHGGSTLTTRATYDLDTVGAWW